MSLPLLSKALHAPLPPDQKLVLLALSNCADGDGFAWPTLRTLERMTGYSVGEIRLALDALQTADVITISANGKPSVGKPRQYLVKGSTIDRLSNRSAQA